ncbi:MAG: PEP-CTERM sorting domain-containing protein, partial [Planctomycetia bacterium]|nr:PEP-CTERM sorting domain-containing protein [Planctomycetia bacterium]
QGRAEFTLGQGTVAVADPDEWDDLGDPESLGKYNAFLTTPSFSMVGAAALSGTLAFASSFRPEGEQTGLVEIAYDGGDWAELARFDSADNRNEAFSVDLWNPGGLSSAVLRFSMINAANNWWWAIDNIELTTSAGLAFHEDFESVELGPGEWEPNGHAGAPVVMENSFTPTPPANWSVDNSRMPTGGVPEWRGWTFVSPELWVAAEDQGRSGFLKGQTVIAVADSDEFDDFTSGEGNYDTSLDTPEISLANVTANSVSVTFDSAWQDEENQTATVTVSYDGGTPIEILRWESAAGAYFHDDNTNETTTLNLENPEGAEKMVLTFAYFNSRNNWFWAIDNLVIAGDVARILGDANGDTFVDDKDASILGAHWMQNEGVGWGDGDFNEDGVVNDKDAAILAANWTGSGGGSDVPEPSTWVLILFGLAALALRRRFR